MAAAETGRTFDLIKLVTCDVCDDTSVQDEVEDEGGKPPLKKTRKESESSFSTEDDNTKIPDSANVTPARGYDSGDIFCSQDSNKIRKPVKLKESLTGLDEIDETKLSFEIKKWDVNIRSSIKCSALRKMLPADALRLFCCKRFIVNEDYILFPYCVKTREGILQRPRIMRVSKIVDKEASYNQVKEELKILDSIIDCDTSDKNSDGFVLFQNMYLQLNWEKNIPVLPKEERQFISSIRYAVFELTKKKHNIESHFRNIFGRFIDIVVHNQAIIEQKCTNRYTVDVEFPLKGESLVVSGKPDILIKNMNGEILAVVESKKYYPMNIKFEDIPDPHGKNDEEASQVKTTGILKKNYEKPVRVLHEELCKDIDGNVCRYMTDNEKKYLDHFLGQMIGDVLMCTAEKPDTLHMLMQVDEMPKKVVRYGIGQVGFKIFFVTVGLNADYVSMGKAPYIKIGDCKAHGLDIFCTRPLDLILAKDRHIIADTLYALMAIENK